MDTKKLRQKILDLAIHGKLVPQDPDDEPASVLLERIRAEKEALIKEGKIKRSKKSASSDTPHYENVPFEVPEGWCWCRLENSFELLSGQDFPPEKYNDAQKGIPYIIGASNIYKGKIVINRWTQTPSVKTAKGDLLVVCKGAGVGKMALNDIGEMHIARQIQAIRDVSQMMSIEYVKMVVSYYIEDIIADANGLIPGLKRELLLSLMMPIPPLQEQRRIIATYEQLMSFIESIDNESSEVLLAINKSKSKILDLAIHGKLVPQDPNDEPAAELLKRINPKAVVSCDNPHYKNVPFEIPSSWAWCKVRDVADVARGGSPRPIKQFLTDSPDGVNWIKIGDAEEGSKYITKTTERIIPEGAKRSRYVKTGDFLLTNSMSFGKPYILGTDGCIHDGWLVISPTDGAYDKNFLYYLLSSSFAYNQFSEKAGGAVVSNLNKDKVSDSLFPLPPIAEQKRIADMVEKLYLNLEDIASTLL